MSYTAKSLEDIAATFDRSAWQATAFSDRLHRTKRAALLAERESQTWKRAAAILRETTLEPVLTPDDWRSIQEAVSNSDMSSEARIRLLDKIPAPGLGESA